MGRWEPDAPGRLQQAALELFGEHGYEQTTVAEIAARAGVTERTFFRHFADKREVFFHGTREFEARWAAAADAAPSTVTALGAAMAALDAAAGLLDGRRALAVRRQAILDANPELGERELAKLARIRHHLADALHRRGAAEGEAALIAGLTLAVFHVAFERWVHGEDDRALAVIAREALAEIGTLARCPAQPPVLAGA